MGCWGVSTNDVTCPDCPFFTVKSKTFLIVTFDTSSLAGAADISPKEAALARG